MVVVVVVVVVVVWPRGFYDEQQQRQWCWWVRALALALCGHSYERHDALEYVVRVRTWY